MEAELIKIKSEAGINDTFSIESVINYIKNYIHGFMIKIHQHY